MDEQQFRHFADETFGTILDAFDDIDVDDADAETAGGVIRIRYRDGSRCVINTQGPTRQIWLAGKRSGWHFSRDEESGRWLHDKGTGDELMSVLKQITAEGCGIQLEL
jgi:iron donor protein CyaY